MPRKRYKAEEIVAKLRPTGLAGPGYGGCNPSDRCERGQAFVIRTRKLTGYSTLFSGRLQILVAHLSRRCIRPRMRNQEI
jgi:hypothetical protein